MPSYWIPKINTEYIFYASLVDSANRPDFIANPTIAAGDFKVSTDGSALTNLDTLPTVTPAAGVMVKFTMSAAEMNGDNTTVVCIDAAGAEWDDLVINFHTAERQITEDGGIDAGALGADLDTYQAKVTMIDDDGGTTDLYTCVWHKNGEPITSGITSPTIQVVKVSDGTDLVASGAMTEIASLGMYKKAEVTNRIVAGDGYIAKVQATIDGSTRTWMQPVGRDD